MAVTDNAQGGLDAFDFFLPLPYRLATVIILGVWLWGLNLWGLNAVAIDGLALIRYPSTTDPPPHIPVFRFATALSIPLASSVLLFWTRSHGDVANAGTFLPNVTFFLILALIVVPSRATRMPSFFPANGRSRLLQTLRRISIGGLAKTEDGKFGDILLADALTSYARPLTELYMVFCAILTSSKVRDCSRSALVPWLLAIPFAIRFRQCIIDAQHANALKYATAFPAIALSVLMKVDKEYPILGLPARHLWLLAASTNALYSFYWDIARDWDLTLFSSDRESPEHPFGLRRIRYFRDEYYYAMIAANLILRFAWALKLSPHLEHYYDIEGGIFILELLEVCRRFLWIYFRAETEWVRNKFHTHDDLVVLSELGSRSDDD